MKRILSFYIFVCITLCTYAQSASELCESGRKEFAVGNFEGAKVYLQKAANMGNSKACGLLGLGYMTGCYESGRDLQLAHSWATKGYSISMSDPDPTCAGVIGMIGTATAKNKKDWIKNLNVLEYAYTNGFSSSHIGNLISVCYLLKGDRAKAQEWATKIREIERDEEDKHNYYMSTAILSKIMLDNKDYMNALGTARDAAFDGNPIAQYVMGRCQIKLHIDPAAGQQRVKKAAFYDYNSPILDINAFDDEIQKYYNSIKNKRF